MLSVVGIVLDAVLDGTVALPDGSVDGSGNVNAATLGNADSILDTVFTALDDYILNPIGLIGAGSLLEEIADAL